MSLNTHSGNVTGSVFSIWTDAADLVFLSELLFHSEHVITYKHVVNTYVLHSVFQLSYNSVVTFVSEEMKGLF